MKIIQLLCLWASLVVSSQSLATQPAKWTNEARHPSNSVDRGFKVIDGLLAQLQVPMCARVNLAPRILVGSSDGPLMVASSTMWSKSYNYIPQMDMTFNRDGHDRVDHVIPYLDSPIVAELYTTECDGQRYHIGYMPKCQNLGRLMTLEEFEERRTTRFTTADYIAPLVIPFGTTSRGGGGGSNNNDKKNGIPDGTVPAPTPLLLWIIAGVTWWVTRRNR